VDFDGERGATTSSIEARYGEEEQRSSPSKYTSMPLLRQALGVESKGKGV
jgi:hypothetical protein